MTLLRKRVFFFLLFNDSEVQSRAAEKKDKSEAMWQTRPVYLNDSLLLGDVA